MKEEEAQKNKGWSSMMWAIYICFIIFVATMGFLRLLGLCRRT